MGQNTMFKSASASRCMLRLHENLHHSWYGLFDPCIRTAMLGEHAG